MSHICSLQYIGQVYEVSIVWWCKYCYITQIKSTWTWIRMRILLMNNWAIVWIVFSFWMLPSISLLICLLILINKSVQFQPQNDPNLDHPEPRKQYFDQQILKPRNSRILRKFRPKQTDAEDNRATVTSRGVGRILKGDLRRYGARERQMRDREGKTDNKINFRRQGGSFYLVRLHLQPSSKWQTCGAVQNRQNPGSGYQRRPSSMAISSWYVLRMI